MSEISRRGFITALFGTAAALAVAKLPVLETLPEVIKLPTERPFAHRKIFEIIYGGPVGGTSAIYAHRSTASADALPLMRGGFGDGGMVLWRAHPTESIILMPEDVLRVDYFPFRAAETPMDFMFIGKDYDERGWERGFAESFTIGGGSSRTVTASGGNALHIPEWIDPATKVYPEREYAFDGDESYDYDEDAA